MWAENLSLLQIAFSTKILLCLIAAFWKKSEVSSKIDHNSILKELSNKFKLAMALYTEEVSIFARHLFRNQSLFVPSHSDPSNLANSMLVLLLAAMTGKINQSIFTARLFSIWIPFACIKCWFLALKNQKSAILKQHQWWLTVHQLTLN